MRVYAIGDVHGEMDLLRDLLGRISVDSKARPARNERVVFVGDVIDRGPGSASVLRSLHAHRSTGRVVVLSGNHEAALVAAYDGDMDALRFWLRFGGIETLASFGADPVSIDRTDLTMAATALRHHVPLEIINWLRNLPTSLCIGDYLFVHAGIRPGIRIKRQKTSDLLWIRDEFLTSDIRHEKVVVHGHTITKSVEFLHNRIGIDTGAHETGTLSAVGFEGNECWTITACEDRLFDPTV